MHYWTKHSIHSKKHVASCNKAQKMRLQLLSIRMEDMEQEATDNQQLIAVSEELKCQDQPNNIVEIIPSQQTGENDAWEKLDGWEFITMNKELPAELQNKILAFQKNQEAHKWTLHYNHGVFGSLVNTVGDILVHIDQLPSKRTTKYYSVGTATIGGIQMEYKTIHILASGFDLSKKYVPQAIFKTSTWQTRSSTTWLTDNHIEMLHLILDQKRVQLPKLTTMKLPNPTVVLSTYFFPKFQEDRAVALSWITANLNRHNLLFEHGCFAEDLLIPINVSNTHWILGIINLKHFCFFAMNPYRPNDPTAEELDKVRLVADELAKEYGFPKCNIKAPDHVESLPIQHSKDTFNCGVYISMYMTIYAFGSFAQTFIGNFLPTPIDECRFLLLAWLLKGEVFFPDLE
jgi:hypothetical protein